MNLKNELKKGTIQALTILIIIGVASITYSYVDFNNTIDEVSSNTPISASEYNKLVKKLNAIDQKQLATAWVSFNGINCTLGLGNQCSVDDSYNISSVEMTNWGKYKINFIEPLNTNKYSVNATAFGNFSNSYNRVVGIYNQQNGFIEIGTTNDQTYTSSTTAYISIQIFGGK